MESIFLHIKKGERKLHLYKNGECVKTYDIVLGFAPEGSKVRRDDGKTPEGEFYVAAKNPKSKYHRGLGLSYPNLADAERGLQVGLITSSECEAISEAIREGRMPPQDTALGSEIYIHGGGLDGDWTRGCVALQDKEMLELFDTIPQGTKVIIEK